MNQEHEVFSRFRPFSGEVAAGCQADFIGSIIRRQFVSDLVVSPDPQTVTVPIPAVNEEYFEWIDVLESVVAAKDSYTMVELGAGFGRWVVRAGMAVQQFHPGMPFRLIAVEAEPTVYTWLKLHFADNGLDPAEHCLIHGAVTEARDDVLFYVGGPRGGQFDVAPDSWYGQALTHEGDAASNSIFDGYYFGFPVLRHESGWRSIRVPAIRLRRLIEDHSRIDLIDMDIEGQELPVITATIGELNRKVKRLHIGTHSKEIEAGLRELLNSHEWECLADYSLFSTSETPWGEIKCENGVQSWVNPRLA